MDLAAAGRRSWHRLAMGGRLRLLQPWALAPGPAVLALALVAPSRWLLYLAYVFLLLPVAAYLWVRLSGPRVRLERRTLTEWARVGDELEESWRLWNDGPLPLLWLEIEDESTVPGYSARRVAAAGAGESMTWRTSARCTNRGVYRLGPLSARLGDPFGVFSYAVRDERERRIVIYPPLVRLPPLTIPHGQRGGLARADLLQIHVTPSVGGLREYVPGDPPSRIHWPNVARRQQLMVKEFDQERAGALWIVLDLHAGSYPPAAPADPRPPPAERAYTQFSAVEPSWSEYRAASPIELAVVLACSLAAAALAEGRSVGLLADDGRRRIVAPGGGAQQLWRILANLVDAQATGPAPLEQVLRQGRSAGVSHLAGGAIAIVTPALDGAWLPALAEQVRGRPGGALALLVAPDAAPSLPLAARLAGSGVASRAFVPGDPLPLLDPPRSGPSARVSPLGRIVRTP